MVLHSGGTRGAVDVWLTYSMIVVIERVLVLLLPSRDC